jgi:DNA-binding IscR family transcriptional regulator
VLRALDGPIAPAECVSEVTSPGYCRRESICLSKPLWEHVRDSLAQVLDTTTLADLCHKSEVKVC